MIINILWIIGILFYPPLFFVWLGIKVAIFMLEWMIAVLEK